MQGLSRGMMKQERDHRRFAQNESPESFRSAHRRDQRHITSERRSDHSDRAVTQPCRNFEEVVGVSGSVIDLPGFRRRIRRVKSSAVRNASEGAAQSVGDAAECREIGDASVYEDNRRTVTLDNNLEGIIVEREYEIGHAKIVRHSGPKDNAGIPYLFP